LPPLRLQTCGQVQGLRRPAGPGEGACQGDGLETRGVVVDSAAAAVDLGQAERCQQGGGSGQPGTVGVTEDLRPAVQPFRLAGMRVGQHGQHLTDAVCPVAAVPGGGVVLVFPDHEHRPQQRLLGVVRSRGEVRDRTRRRWPRRPVVGRRVDPPVVDGGGHHGSRVVAGEAAHHGQQRLGSLRIDPQRGDHLPRGGVQITAVDERVGPRGTLGGRGDRSGRGNRGR
jgi:hypothetical protein